MLTFDEYVKIAEKAVSEIKYPEQPKALYEPIAYTMSLGGKRLRPVLALMACDAFCGSHAPVVSQAVGIELYHNFTLLHDDVMDKADLRRGKPTVHVKWNDNVAILSGDAMLTMASQYIADTDSSRQKKAIELFNRTAIEVYEGQQYDMDFESRQDVSEDEYIEMIRLKTSVLLGCACKMGAVIAGADDESADAIYQYAMNLGVAFQLQDDILDVYGDPATFGKAIGGDIMNNKKTYMLINALNLATGAVKEELTGWINAENPVREEKVKAVTEIYNRLGIRQLAEQAMDRYNAKALEIIGQIPTLSDESKKSFVDFANMLLHRNK